MDATLPRSPTLSTTSAVFIPEYTGPQDSIATRVRVSELGTDPFAITCGTIRAVPFPLYQPLSEITTLVETRVGSEIFTTAAPDSPTPAEHCTTFGPGATHSFYVPPINADGQRVTVDYWGMDLEDQGLRGTPDDPGILFLPGRQTTLQFHTSAIGTNAGLNSQTPTISQDGFKLKRTSDEIKKEDQDTLATSSDVRTKEEPQD
jgi:hypothetical protein